MPKIEQRSEEELAGSQKANITNENIQKAVGYERKKIDAVTKSKDGHTIISITFRKRNASF